MIVYTYVISILLFLIPEKVNSDNNPGELKIPDYSPILLKIIDSGEDWIFLFEPLVKTNGNWDT